MTPENLTTWADALAALGGAVGVWLAILWLFGMMSILIFLAARELRRE